MKNKGYGSPKIDVWIQGTHGYGAIRGREQQLMDYYGGVGNPKLGNSIRGVNTIHYDPYRYMNPYQYYPSPYFCPLR